MGKVCRLYVQDAREEWQKYIYYLLDYIYSILYQFDAYAERRNQITSLFFCNNFSVQQESGRQTEKVLAKSKLINIDACQNDCMTGLFARESENTFKRQRENERKPNQRNI